MRFKKAIALLVLTVLTANIFLGACQNTQKVVKSVAFTEGSYKTEYVKGETLDFDALKLTLTYTDDSTKQIDASEFTVNKSFVNTSISGSYTLRAEYTDPVNGVKHQDSVSIRVNEPPADPDKFVESVAFKAGTLITSYLEQDEEDFSSVQLEATLADSSKVTIERANFSLNEADIDFSTAGLYSLVATYIDLPNNAKVHTVSAVITVREDVSVDSTQFVTSVAIKANTYTTPLFVGDDIPSSSGVAFPSMVLVLTRANGNTTEVSRSGFSLNIGNLTTQTAGHYAITASYVDTLNANNTLSTSVSIEVREQVVEIEDLIVDIVGFTDGLQTTYQIGEVFRYRNILLEVELEDESTAEVAYGVFELNLSEFIELSGANEGKIKGAVGKRTLIASIELDDVTLTAEAEITIVPAYEELDPNTKIESINITGGTKSVYLQDERFSYRNIEIELVPVEGIAIAKSYPAFAVSASIKGTSTAVDIDEVTEQTGEYTITVSYYDAPFESYVTTSYDITVNERIPTIDPLEIIYNYDTSDSLREYASNISEKLNKENEFVTRDDGYAVGTDNPFAFKPRLTRYDSFGFPYVYSGSFAMNITVSLKVGNGNYQPLTLDPLVNDDDLDLYRLAKYVSVDSLNSSFSFKKAAIADNMRFKIEQKPANPDLIASAPQKEKVILLDNIYVVEGFNVYDEVDLSRMDNTDRVFPTSPVDGHEPEVTQRWLDFKREHGIPTAGQEGYKDAVAIILHKNMLITKDVIPEHFIHSSGAANGSLRNWLSLYSHITLGTEGGRYEEEEKFSFIGNYFTMDASQIPLITTESFLSTTPVNASEFVFSNSTLFSLGGSANWTVAGRQNKSYVKNTNFIGNAPRGDNPAFTGGLRLMEGSGVETVVDNVIARSFYQFMRPYGISGGSLHLDDIDVTMDEKFLVKNTKLYDSFSNMFDVFDHSNVVVENCEFKRAGGPIFVMMDRSVTDSTKWNYDPTNQYFPQVTATNSTFEVWLAGDEVFFQAGDSADMTGDLKGLEAFYVGLTAPLMGGSYAKNSTTKKMTASGNRDLSNIIAILMPENFVDMHDNNAKIELFNCKGADGVSLGSYAMMDFASPTLTNYASSTTPLAQLGGVTVAMVWGDGAPVLQTNGAPSYDASTFMVMPVGSTVYTWLHDGSAIDANVPGFIGGNMLNIMACLHGDTNAKIGVFTQFFTVPYTPQA